MKIFGLLCKSNIFSLFLSSCQFPRCVLYSVDSVATLLAIALLKPFSIAIERWIMRIYIYCKKGLKTIDLDPPFLYCNERW